jgi:hypothetical protein
MGPRTSPGRLTPSISRAPHSFWRLCMRTLKLGHLQLLEDRAMPSTYFVAPSGSDASPGSFASPFATIQHALNVATHPGDTVEVRAGDYREKITLPASGSSPGGYITLTAFPGEQPILDGTGVAGANMVMLNNLSFVKVIGFEIENLSGAINGSGVRVVGHGSNIEIQDNVIHDIAGVGATGIAVDGISLSTPISYLTIDSNKIYNAQPAPSAAMTLDGNITQFQITGNQIHDVNNIGIDLIGGDRAVNRVDVVRNGVVRGNTVYNAHAGAGGLAAGIMVDGGVNVTLEYNVTHNNDVGLEVGATNRGFVASGDIVRNNLIYQNDKAGLVLGGNGVNGGRLKASTFVNNTVSQNDTLNSGLGQLWMQYASGNVVTNNAFSASTNDVLLDSSAGNSGNRLNNNLYFTADGDAVAHFTWNGIAYLGLENYQARTGADAGSIFGDPEFVDGSAGNFQLQAGSSAIDAGSAVRGRFAATDFTGRSRDDGTPDIGAFEYIAPDPNAGQGLSADQKLRAEELTSLFENDTIDLQYAYVEALNDGRGYTAGRAGFCTGTGDLLDVVERYTAEVPGNPLAPFLPRLLQLAQAHSGSTSGLGGFVQAWQTAANDPAFRAVQDQVVDETYYQPAVDNWVDLGMHSPLGLAALYDAIIQHGDGDDPDGLPALIARTTQQMGGTPATGVDEHQWVVALLQVRRADLAHSFDPATRAAWAESVGRVDVFSQIVASGNWNLAGPIEVQSDVYGDVTIP